MSFAPSTALAALFPAIDHARLLAAFWTGGPPIVHHGPRERLVGLADVAELADIHAALAVHVGALKAVHETGGAGHREVDLTDNHSPREAAEALYAAGLSICAGAFDRVSRPVQRFLASVAADLGVPPRQGFRANLYASPPGSGFGRHFDSQNVLVVQLHGHKRWHVDRRPAVAFPTANFIFGESVRGELAEHFAGDTGEPRDVETVEMSAGSVLLLPSGHWHATSATQQHSLSLTLTFPVTSRLDVLLDALRGRLLADPRWRAPLGPRWDDAAGQSEAELGLCPLVAELACELDAGTPGATIARAVAYRTTRDATTRYRRTQGARFTIAEDAGKQSLSLRVGDAEPQEFELEPELCPLFDWLSARDEWFDAVAARSVARYAAEGTVEDALRVLVQHHALLIDRP